MKSMWKCFLSRRIKVSLFQTMDKSVYGCESWILKESWTLQVTITDTWSFQLADLCYKRRHLHVDTDGHPTKTFVEVLAQDAGVESSGVESIPNEITKPKVTYQMNKLTYKCNSIFHLCLCRSLRHQIIWAKKIPLSDLRKV